MEIKSDIQIAQEAHLENIKDVAAKVGVTEDELEMYGKYTRRPLRQSGGSFMMPTTSSSISLMLRIYFCRTSAPRFTCTVSGSSLLSRYALMECSFVLPSKNHPTKTSVSCSFRWNRIFSTKNLCVSMVRPLSPLTPRSISLISYSTITIPTFCVKLLPRLYIPFVLC